MRAVKIYGEWHKIKETQVGEGNLVMHCGLDTPVKYIEDDAIVDKLGSLKRNLGEPVCRACRD